MAVPVLSAQTPSLGSIAWEGFSITYNGKTYTVPSYSTSKKYTWWDYDGAGAPVFRTNRILDPRATTYWVSLGASRWFGPTGNGTYTTVTGSDGPDGITTYARKTWTVAGNAGDTGFDAAQNIACNPGDVYTASCYMRSSSVKSAYMAFNDSTGRTYGTLFTLQPNVWTRVSYTYTAPAGVTSFAPFPDIYSGGSDGTHAVGATVDATGLLVEGVGEVRDYFDGSKQPKDTGNPAMFTNGQQARWTGAPNASTSVIVTPAPSLEVADTLPDGRLQGNQLDNPSFNVLRRDTDAAYIVTRDWRRDTWPNVGNGSASTTELVTLADGSTVIDLTNGDDGSGPSLGPDYSFATSPGDWWYVEIEVEAIGSAVPGVYVRSLNQYGQDWGDSIGEDRPNTGGTVNRTIPTGKRTLITGAYMAPMDGVVTGFRPVIFTYTPIAGIGKKLRIHSFKASRLPIRNQLTNDDTLLFLNKQGVPVNAVTASVVDGSIIATESILADAIGANQVTSEHILAGSIDAVHIRAGAITTNELAAGAVTTENLAAGAVQAGTILAGAIDAMDITGARLTIGNITLNPLTGLTVPQPGGGVIQFPADGSDATIWANVVTKSITIPINGTVTLQGVQTVQGTIRASNGVPSPTTKPTMSVGRPTVNVSAIGSNQPLSPGDSYTSPTVNYLGLIEDPTDAAYWLTTQAYPGWAPTASNSYTYIVRIHKTTGATSFFRTLNRFTAYGITRVGTVIYLLGTYCDTSHGHGTALDNPTVHPVEIFRMNTGLTTTGDNTSSTPSWSHRTVFTPANDYLNGGKPTIGTTGGDVLVTRFENTGDILRVHRYGASNIAYINGNAYNTFPNNGNAYITYYGEGVFDFGVARGVLSVYGGNNLVFAGDGNRLSSANDWSPDSPVRGMWWDGSRFYAMGADGWVYTMSAGATTSTTIHGTYTWYDDQATGGTHETAASPAASIVRPARTFLTIYGSPAPQAGSALTDSARMVRFYLGTTAAATRLQGTQPGASVSSLRYETVVTASGTVAPTTSNFGSLGTVGALESGLVTPGTRGWQFKGDGSASFGNHSIAAADGETTILAPLTRRFIPNIGGFNVAVPNNTTATHWTRAVTYGAGDISNVARRAFVTVENRARCGGNQQVGQSLQVSFDSGTTYTEISNTTQHNAGDAAMDMGATHMAWISFPAGTTIIQFRLVITVAAGGYDWASKINNLTITCFR